tara:strand:- start:147 stop:392 length:246 start_codon:yes stop_codon:yes gene_type:complete
MAERQFRITKRDGEMYNAEVTDSYGTKYQNWFDTAAEANDWIYFIWEQEDWFANVDNEELLANAIHDCRQIDHRSHIRAIM